MQKLKELFPNKFGRSKATNGPGRLEADALPVDDDETNANSSGNLQLQATPTPSAELTESVVRELSDPNYNSMEVATISPDATALANSHMDNAGVTSATMNTMNVHNAQQQVVMQFSNANNLHFGAVYNFNSSISASARNAASCGQMEPGRSGKSASLNGSMKQKHSKTTSIVAMMQSQEEPNHRMLDTIATHLGEGWKSVLRDLGRSDGQIEQASIDHQMHGGIREVIYQLLLQWLRNADDGVGTLGHITTLLWESNHRDCVHRMKAVWKSESHRKTSR